jgi:broad specificity phosphatase PhoE
VTTFFLVRHGQTDAVGSYLAGTAAGTPPNRDGEAQVQRLAEQFRDVALAAIVSSPLERARQTAEPIARTRGFAIEVSAAFVEFEIGAWTGRTFADIDADPEWRRFNAARSLVRAPGGELMLDVQQRAVAALIDLAARYPNDSVLVVSHGDVIRAALMYFLGMPIDMLHRIDVAPASVSIVTLDGWTPIVRQVNGDTVRALG